MAELVQIQAQIRNRTGEALRKIGVTTDLALNEFTKDAKEMARALLRDKVGAESTGKLASSIDDEKKGDLKYAVLTTADNEKGYGYGAAQEWGWHPKGKGKKVKGKKFITRAVFGMIKRWARGERWR
jgi:hypothetical protein